MISRARIQAFLAWRPVRLALFVLGILLMMATPAVAILPGPGGIFVFAAGLTLALRNSDWAKRRYVRFKRWQPRAGAWADWGMRRKSARRRKEQQKVQDSVSDLNLDELRTGCAHERQTRDSARPN